MILNNRYLVEHQGLPALLYSEPAFPNLLIENTGEIMANLYRTACRISRQKEPCPFKKSDFRFDLHVMAGDPEDDRMILTINMPEPVVPPDCERVFVCFHRESDAVNYYTVEKSFDGNVLCSWDESGTHHNYDDAPATEAEQLERVMDMFK